MIPRKPKDIYKKTAVKEEVSVDVVEDVVDFYFKEVRRALSNLEDMVINVEGLGSFRSYRTKLLRSKERYERIQKRIPETDSFRRAAIRKDADERIENINRLLTLLDEDTARKEETKLRRVEYDLKNLEKQAPDNRGLSQQAS